MHQADHIRCEHYYSTQTHNYKTTKIEQSTHSHPEKDLNHLTRNKHDMHLRWTIQVIKLKRIFLMCA